MDDITDAKIIVLTVKNKKTIKKLDELANDDNANFSDAIAIEGQIRTLDPEIEGYYRDALASSGIADYCDYYTVAVDATQTRFFGWMIVLGALAIGVLCIVAFAKINKQIKNEKNLAYTNATPAMGQPGNPYVNPVTGQPYDAGVVNPVTGQAYNQTPDAGYGPGTKSDLQPDTGWCTKCSIYTGTEYRQQSVFITDIIIEETHKNIKKIRNLADNTSVSKKIQKNKKNSCIYRWY